MSDQEEMFASIRAQFPRRTKRTRQPRDPNRPSLGDALSGLFRGRERDFSGIETLQGSTLDSGADTGLPFQAGDRDQPLPRTATPPPPVETTVRSRRNVAIPLGSPAGRVATEGISRLDSSLEAGTSLGGADVGSVGDVVPEDARLVIGFGGGGGVTAGVVRGQTVLLGEDGAPLAGNDRVADTNMTAATANNILNQDRATTQRYQDVRWAESLSGEFQDTQSRIKITRALSDMGYAPSGNSKFSEGQRLSHVIYDYEAENGLQPRGLVQGVISPETLKSIQEDIEVMHRLQQDLLR